MVVGGIRVRQTGDCSLHIVDWIKSGDYAYEIIISQLLLNVAMLGRYYIES